MNDINVKNILLSGNKNLSAGDIYLTSSNINTYDERDEKNYFSNALFLDLDETNSANVTMVEVFIKLFNPGAFFKSSNNPKPLELSILSIDMTLNIKSQLITFGGYGSIYPGAVFNDYLIGIKNTAGTLIINNIWLTLKK